MEQLGQVPDVGCPVEFVAELKFLGIVGCLSSGVVGHLLLGSVVLLDPLTLHLLLVKVLVHGQEDARLTVQSLLDGDLISRQVSDGALLEARHEIPLIDLGRIELEFLPFIDALPHLEVHVNSDGLVVSEVSDIVVADHRAPYGGVMDEHLVKLVAQQVGFLTISDGYFEAKLDQVRSHCGEMVVEVTTHDHGRVFVLSQDVLDDFRDPLSSFELICLFPSFKVTRDEVDPVCPISELDLSPVEVRPQRLHELHPVDLASINQGNAATFGARSGLLDVVAFEVSRFRQLGLTQQPDVNSHSRDGLLQLLLLPPSINAFHIQAPDVKCCP